jgi:UDPglucose 6-dehydrogenase
MNKLGIIGMGVLGTSYYYGYKHLGWEVKGYDKFRKCDVDTIQELFDCEALFLCLPTICDANNNPDYTPFYDVLPQLKGYNGFIFVRSTMMPGETDHFANEFNLHLIHCPEFLTEKTARMDFFTPSRILVGTKDGCDWAIQEQLEDYCEQKLFKPFIDKGVPIYFASSLETEMAKVAANTFLAVKVTYANEMNQICNRVGIDWERVKKLMQDDNRLATHSHMRVTSPGGYSGMCLPKDSKQLITYAKEHGYEAEFFKAMDKSNDKFRTI